MLLIAILLGSLAAGQRRELQAPARRWASLGAVVATGVTWVLATLVIDIAPVNRELLEAITALVAVVVLVVVSFWLVARLEHRRRMEFMRARTAARDRRGHRRRRSSGSASPPSTARASRPCSSTRRSSLFAEGLGLWVWLGAVAAAVALAASPTRSCGSASKLPLKPMLITGASILLLLSVAFAGNAVRSLQEADLSRRRRSTPAGRGCRCSSPS